MSELKPAVKRTGTIRRGGVSKEHIFFIITQFFCRKFDEYQEKERKRVFANEYMSNCE